MPFDDGQWQSALKRMQPSIGGVMPPSQPGNTGNIPYAPGMMSTYNGPQAPLARDMYQAQQGPSGLPQGGMASEGPVEVQPGGVGMGMSMPQAQGLIAALTNIIRAQQTPQATQGRGPRY